MRTFATIVILIAFFASTPVACAENNQIEQLRWIENANPTADAEAALKKKDYTLLAVQGYTWVIPGTEELKKSEYKARYGVRVIQGTSDAALNKEHLRLIHRATEYAASYNRYLLKRLGVSDRGDR